MGVLVPGSIRIGTIAGIPLRVHHTWLFAFLLIAWSLASGYFPAISQGWGLATYWILGIIAALGLFASVVIHELSHSLVAMARGYRVRHITLFIFGGVSSVEGEAKRPWDEFIMSVVGPLASFALAVAFWGAWHLFPNLSKPLGATLLYLAAINGMVAVFNMLPGFPLDGGRVLRSIIWGLTKNLRRATDLSSFAGQGLGFVFVFLGLSQFLNGNVLNGLWIVFVGWFLNSNAESSRQHLRPAENLRNWRVSDLMSSEPALAKPDLTVQSFVFDHVIPLGIRAMPIMDDGHLIGIVSLADAKKVPTGFWPRTPVRAVMTPAPLRTIAAEQDVATAISLLADGDLAQMPVLSDGKVVGMLSRADVLRLAQFSGELGPRDLPRPISVQRVDRAA
jgi:Zn-dependent protease/CBS domain-containing protein